MCNKGFLPGADTCTLIILQSINQLQYSYYKPEPESWNLVDMENNFEDNIKYKVGYQHYILYNKKTQKLATGKCSMSIYDKINATNKFFLLSQKIML